MVMLKLQQDLQLKESRGDLQDYDPTSTDMVYK